jgi:hypothetical protein
MLSAIVISGRSSKHNRTFRWIPEPGTITTDRRLSAIFATIPDAKRWP